MNTTVSAATVRVYHAMAIQAKHIDVPSKAIDKTESRHIAERSLIAATTFALVVAATVYRVGVTAKGLDFPEKTTAGAKVLMDLVLEHQCFGCRLIESLTMTIRPTKSSAVWRTRGMVTN